MAIDVKGSEVVAQNANQNQRNFEEEQKLNFEKLRKKNEALEQQLQQSEQQRLQQQQLLAQVQESLRPQPKDDFESLPEDELIDKGKLRKILEKERQILREEAVKSAKQAYEAIDRENFASKLKSAYPDYESVVSEENANRLQEEDPEFMAALAKVDDPFTRRELAYKKMKKLAVVSDSKVKAQQVVDENRKAAANFMTPSGQAPMNTNPYGFEFDVRNPQAREKAYERLKAAQKKGV